MRNNNTTIPTNSSPSENLRKVRVPKPFPCLFQSLAKKLIEREGFNMAFRLVSIWRRVIFSPLLQVRTMVSGEQGSGVGKGGGAGGHIRSAGGAFGKMEHAHEEQHFRKLQDEQLKGMKDHLKDAVEQHEKEIQHHEEAIRRHREALEKHKKGINKLSDGDSSDDDDKK